MKNFRNQICLLFTLLIPCLPAAEVKAQDTAASRSKVTNITEAEAHKELILANNHLKEAFALFPNVFCKNGAEAEQRQLQKSQDIVSNVVSQVKGAYKIDSSGFKLVQNNIRRLNEQLSSARKINAVCLLQEQIQAKHKNEQAADPVLVKQYQDAIYALASIKSSGFKATTEFFVKQSRIDLQKNEDISAKVAGSTESAKIQANEQELNNLIKQANLIYSQLKNRVESSDVPLLDGDFNAAIAAANSFAAKNPLIMKSYMTRLRHLRIMSSFLEGDKNIRAEKVAQHLEGGKVKSGFARTKSLIMNFKADADWCYAMVLRDTRSEKQELSLRSRYWKKIKVTQSFTLDPDSRNLYRYEGFCTPQKGKVRVKAYLSERSKKLKYVVIGWPRNETPRWLFQNVEFQLSDSCDASALLSRFEEPMPGSLIIYKGSLHQVLSFLMTAGRVNLLDIAGNKISVPITEIYEAKDIAEDAPRYKFKGCPELKKATGKLSIKYGKCIAKVEKSFASKFKRAERKLKYAKTEAKEEKAAEKIAALEEKEEARKEKKCSPIQDQIMEEGRLAHQELEELSEAQKSLPRPSDRIKQGFVEMQLLQKTSK